MIVVWILPLLGALFGALFLLDALLGTRSAVQQAASAASACAFCVIPYIAARAIQHLVDMQRPRSTAEVNLQPPVNLVPPAQRPNNAVAIGVVVVALFAAVLLALGLNGLTRSFDGSTDAATRACLEFKEIYEKLDSPTLSQRDTSSGCRAKGYW